MSITLKKNGGLPSLLTDFFGSSLLSPARELLNFDSDLFSSRLGINVPTVNIKENAKAFVLELAAPGLERKDFVIEVNNHTLKISSEKEEEKNETGEEYSKREYSFNSFMRSFTLPENVKEGEIDAKYENGILKLTIPKLKEAAVNPARKIAVS